MHSQEEACDVTWLIVLSFPWLCDWVKDIDIVQSEQKWYSDNFYVIVERDRGIFFPIGVEPRRM